MSTGPKSFSPPVCPLSCEALGSLWLPAARPGYGPSIACPAQGERGAGRVRRCLQACGSCHGSSSGIGAGGDSVSSPVYLSVYNSPSQEGKGLAQGCLAFYIRSCLAGLQRRLVPVLSLSSWEPWAFEFLCVWGRSGGPPEAPAQGSFLRWSAAGGSGYLVRDGRWQPVLTLLVLCSGDRCCLAWGEFWARCCRPAPLALVSVPGCPAGVTAGR